jgi:eukaryotic-like serine/threonine-protein kinase
MHTTVASSIASDSMITADIDFTADLDDTALDAHPIQFARPDASPAARIEDDVPFRDEVPAKARREERFPVAPGRVLSDRFVLTKLLGTGGTCSVFLARDLEAELDPRRPRFVAVKTLRPDYKDPVRAVERLQREFEHARQLSHAGIVRVFDLSCDGDVTYMTMELLEGESLASIMRRQNGPLAPYLARRVLRGTAEALAYAHAAGVVHGDLNPANIFVLNGERVKLIDFGAACSPDQAPAAAATLAYASPQVLQRETPQVKDDVFAFAAIAYQILSGGHPFGQRSSLLASKDGARPEAPTEVTSEQALALMGALSWDRETRPENVRELASSLAPDAPRRRVAIEPRATAPQVTTQSDWRWWALGALCVAAMIAATVATRVL